MRPIMVTNLITVEFSTMKNEFLLLLLLLLILLLLAVAVALIKRRLQ